MAAVKQSILITFVALSLLAGCASLQPNSDPLTIDVAGIEPLPGEGLELRLAVRVRIQNPNDAAGRIHGRRAQP